MSISLGLELHNHEFLKLPEPQPGTRGELMLAFGKSIHSCTHLGALNIPARQKLLSDCSTRATLDLYSLLAESARPG
jgi:hypothetical protein